MGHGVRRDRNWATGVGLLLASIAAQAAPVAGGPALATDGDGLNSNWVRLDFSPQGIQDTLDALAGRGVVETASFIAPYIDFHDGSGGTDGVVASPTLRDPFTHVDEFGTPSDDPAYAVRFSGFLNVQVSGEYQFQAHTDDGFRFTLGGEVLGQFDGNRGPSSDFMTIELAAGLYSLDFIGWEQGGIFVDELTWLRPGDEAFVTIGTDAGGRALFSAAPVPVPAALPMLLTGLATLGGLARRRRG